MENRIEMIKAMDMIAWAINNEDILSTWLAVGVADGDVENDDLEYYCDDDTFAELMGVFLRRMALAKDDGGLYYDGIVSR